MSRAIAPAGDDFRPRVEAVTASLGPFPSSTEREAATYSRSLTSISGRPGTVDSGHQFRVKQFPNGDSYAGDWGVGGLPEGGGKYVWADGSSYDGEWSKGKKHGKGVFTWPSGATYDGEWVGGGMQGLGTYTGNDGSWYRGSWNANVKHGLGRKKYSNGDVYEGLWQFGVADGPGRYKWANGNEYLGEWSNGTMSGKGTFLWSSGDRYDGEWVDGFEHGHGTFTWADGASYEGTWSRGLKDGRGTYYPAGTRRQVEFTRLSKRSLTLQRDAPGAVKSDKPEVKPAGGTADLPAASTAQLEGEAGGEEGGGVASGRVTESEPESDGGSERLAALHLDGLARQRSQDFRDEDAAAGKMAVADDVVDCAAVVADGEAGAAAARESSLLRKIERRVSDPERRKSVSPKLSEFAARAASGGIIAAHEDGGKGGVRIDKIEKGGPVMNGSSFSMSSLSTDRRLRSSDPDSWRRLGDFHVSEPPVEPGESSHCSPRSPEKLVQNNGEHPVLQDLAAVSAGDKSSAKPVSVAIFSREAAPLATYEEGKGRPARSAPDGGPAALAAPPPAQPSDSAQMPIPPMRSFPAPSMPGGLDKGPIQQPKLGPGWGVPQPSRQSRVHPPPEGEDLAQPSQTPTTPQGAEPSFGESPARGVDGHGGYPTLRVHTPRRLRDGDHRSRMGSGSLSGSAESSPSTQWRGSGSSPARTEALTESMVDDRNADGLEGDWEPSPKGPVPVVREYVHGALISETTKDADELRSPSQVRRKGHRRKSGEIKRPGETIFKGHRSYDLMCNLQLGIRYTVSRINGFPRREIKPSDFRTEDEFSFPRSGSKTTPVHQSVDFKWKDYCPMVFRHLREMFYIDSGEYMLSLCGDDALRELSSPGKSRAVFYLSKDDRFIIKTMRKTEVKVLLRMLPHYYEHVRLYENTLVTKFFGLHRVKPYKGGRVVRFVVMGNMFCSDLRIHRRFDLKGSSQGRSTDKIEIDENTTLKDLDLDMVFKLEEGWRDRLLLQIEHDCKFLEEQRIMDYSLLLGVHFRATSFLEPAVGEGPEKESDGEDPAAALTEIDYGDYDDESPGPLRSETDKVVRHAPMRTDTMRPLHGSNGCTAELNLAFGRPRVHLGINMAATALPLDEETKLPDISRAYDVVLYFGIIDVLQEYDLTKKIEHTYKAMHYNSNSISAVEPSLYSHRFQTFVCKTFA